MYSVQIKSGPVERRYDCIIKQMLPKPLI